jgi:acyl carrier protein
MQMPDNRESVFDAAFNRLVAEALATGQVPHDDVDLLEAGLDSFGFVKLLMVLEDEFRGFWPIEQLSCFAGITRVGVLRSIAKNTLWERAK